MQNQMVATMTQIWHRGAVVDVEEESEHYYIIRSHPYAVYVIEKSRAQQFTGFENVTDSCECDEAAYRIFRGRLQVASVNYPAMNEGYRLRLVGGGSFANQIGKVILVERVILSPAVKEKP